MKILWLTEFYPQSSNDIIGGVQSRCYYVGEYLKKEVDLSIIQSTNQKWARPSLLSFVIRLAYFFISILRGILSNFDLVESSNAATHLQALIIARFKGKPVVFWYPDVFIGSWISKFGIVGIFGEIAERIVLMLGADSYIAISDEVKQKLITHGVNKSKITTIYCGVDVLSNSKVKINTEENNYDLICISRLRKYKRISDLISALVNIKTKIPNISLLIVGEGPENRELIALSEKLNLTENITFVSKISSHAKLLGVLKNSKILCHPSIVEGFGIVLVEAMSLGVPYVAANISTVLEVTQNGHGGLIFEQLNIRDLSNKIIDLLTNNKLYKQKSVEGQKISQKYDWKNITDQTLNLYKRVIHG